MAAPASLEQETQGQTTWDSLPNLLSWALYSRDSDEILRIVAINHRLCNFSYSSNHPRSMNTSVNPAIRQRGLQKAFKIGFVSLIKKRPKRKGWAWTYFLEQALIEAGLKQPCLRPARALLFFFTLYIFLDIY